MKVLVSPTGELFQSFKQLLTLGKNTEGWGISCIGPKYYYNRYKDFVDSKDDIYEPASLSSAAGWESNPEIILELERIIEESQNKISRPSSRVILACERDIGKGFSNEKYFFQRNKLAKNVLSNKKYSNIYLLRSFKFYYDLIADLKPDLCLGFSPAGKNLPLYYLLEYLNIPFLFTIHSNIFIDRHYWSKSWGCFNDDVLEKFDFMKRNNVSPSGNSTRFINDFRHKPYSGVYFSEVSKRSKRAKSLIATNKAILTRIIHRLVPILKNIKVDMPKPVLEYILESYRSYFLYKKQRKLYHDFSVNELSEMKYIYYPCHQEPEFVCNIRATDYYDQLQIIKRLSFNLPYGYKLLVREHFANIGRKRTKYLKELITYPGVILIDAYDDQYKYLKNADLVITVNGSSGFEGILLGKKTLTLDKTNYDPLVKISCNRDSINVGEAIVKLMMLEDSVADNDIALFLDAEKLTTFESKGSSIDEIKYIKSLLAKYQASNNPAEVIQ